MVISNNSSERNSVTGQHNRLILKITKTPQPEVKVCSRYQRVH